MTSWDKAHYIAEGLGENADDVYDVLEGHIQRPLELIYNVQHASDEYDRAQERELFKNGVHQTRTFEG